MDPSPLDRFRTGQALRGQLLRELVDGAGAGATLSAGSLVGPWRVLEVLGSGGMSHVYLAERADGRFEQRVALKLVRGNPALRDRLRHERQIVAGLRHPHIVSLVDGGDTPEGDLWFAMALVEGQPIDAYVREQAPGWRARLALFDTVCAALEYAHARGLIHRDLKPANILVDEQGHPRLLDFGIAIDGDDAQAGGDHALTPGFASPEQLAGEPLDIRSDIYQLGLVLRGLLDPLGNGAPVPMPVRRDLQHLLTTATATSATARYATVAALREDLAAVIARRPLARLRDSWRVRLARAIERHRAATLIGTAAVLALLASLAIAAWRLDLEHREALAQAARAQAVAKFLVDTLGQANPYAAKANEVRVLDAVDLAAARINDTLAVSPDVRRELRASIGGVYLAMDEGQRCLDLFAGETAAADLAQAAPLDRAASQVLLSECHIVLDQRDQTRHWLEQAATTLKGSSGPAADALRAFVLVDRGQLLSLSERLTEANLLFDQARTVAIAAGALEQEYRATRMLAANLQAAGDDARAVTLFTRALELARQTLGPTHRSTLTASSLLAISLARLERFDEAERTAEAALQAAKSIRHRGTGPEIVLAQLYDNYATVLWQHGHLTECIEQAGQALAIYRRLAEPGSTQGFNPSWRVAACAYQLRDLEPTRIHAEAALGYAENGLPVGKINALRMLAAVAVRSGKFDAARDYLQRADTTLATAEVASPTVFSAMFLTHALLAAKTGDAATARARLAEADHSIEQSGQNPAWLRQERESVAALVEAASR